MSCSEEDIVEVLTRLTPRLKRIIASFRIPAAEAEDLVQDACLSLVRNWTRIECPEAWLTQALYRMCYASAISRRCARLEYFDGNFLEALAPLQRPAQERAELFWDLNTLAAFLSSRQKVFLQLRYGLGMSSEEIAARLGYCSVSVRKSTSRALARLRRAVEG
ncbi:MAG TPA: sigma-70 family RNA polymerase sigma factor [Thermoanaerobaculia bacterium]|nr:sigma-70 family RNA polymerase sigma factor [Thermoanaerobaculia bacterium]